MSMSREEVSTHRAIQKIPAELAKLTAVLEELVALLKAGSEKAT